MIVQDYLPILLQVLLAIGFAGVALVASGAPASELRPKIPLMNVA